MDCHFKGYFKEIYNGEVLLLSLLQIEQMCQDAKQNKEMQLVCAWAIYLLSSVFFGSEHK